VSLVEIKATRGINRPLSLLSISKIDEGSGEVVLMPTWATTIELINRMNYIITFFIIFRLGSCM